MYSHAGSDGQRQYRNESVHEGPLLPFCQRGNLGIDIHLRIEAAWPARSHADFSLAAEKLKNDEFHGRGHGFGVKRE
jgi:hypothetical protein